MPHLKIFPNTTRVASTHVLTSSHLDDQLSSSLLSIFRGLWACSDSVEMAGGKILNTKTRGGNRQVPEQTTGEKIKEHQRQLHADRQAQGLQKYENGGGTNTNGNEKAVKKYESYRREDQLPRHIDDRRIHVDEQRQSVIIPVYGYAVPYHISTIKNVTKTEGTDAMTLRINFQTPGQIAGKKEDMVSI